MQKNGQRLDGKLYKYAELIFKWR